MKINLSELSIKGPADWKYTCLLHIMTGKAPDPKKWKEVFNIPLDAPITVDVVVTVNGVDVPFDYFMRILEDSYEGSVKEASIKLVEEKFASLNSMLYDMELGITNSLKDMEEDE